MKKAFLICIMMPALLLCMSCSLYTPVIPQDIEKGVLLFVAPQSGDYASEGVPAAKVFTQVVDNATQNDLVPYDLEAVLIDEAIGAEAICEEISNYIDAENVLGVCGFWYADNAKAAAELCVKKRLPLLLWATMREDLTSDASYPYVLRLCPTARTETALLIDRLVRRQSYTDWLLICDDSSYGRANNESAVQKLKELDGNIIYSASLNKSSELAGLMKDLAGKKADIIYFGADPELLPEFVKALAQNKINLPLAATDAAAIEGRLLRENMFTVDYDFGKYSSFGRDYFDEAFFDCEMGVLTPLAYDAANLFISALKNCGSAPDMELLADTLAASEQKGVMGKISFDLRGDSSCTGLLKMLTLKNGYWE